MALYKFRIIIIIISSNVQRVRLAADDALIKCVVTEDVLFSVVAFKTLTFHKEP